MSTNYPGSIDTFVNPVPTSDTVIVPHSTQHTNINDSVLALETKVGANASAVTTTHDYKLGEVTGADKAAGKTATQTLTNKTLSSPKVTVGSDAIGDMYYNSVGAVGTQVRLPAGSNGQVLTIAGGVPSYASPSSANSNYIVDTGAANAYVATLSPAAASYTAGMLVQFKATNANTTVSTVNVNGLGVKTIMKLGGATNLASGDIAAGMVVQLEYDGTNFVMLNPVANAPALIKSGGTGVDGVLNVTSGTTTIDLASANFVTKNYTSINISAGATVNFSNPAAGGTIIQFKSQGAITILGTLDASGTGTAGGAAATGTSVVGNVGTSVAASLLIISGGATGGGAGATGSGVAGGSATTNTYFYLPSTNLLNSGLGKYLIPGTGGGSGSVGATAGTSGAGGRGGGALYIECAGAWNFTGTVNVSGLIGGTFTTAGGGGGGGGAGSFLTLYSSLTANSGTVTNNSGAGGTGGGASNCGGGGGGASTLANGGSAGFNSGAPVAPTNGGGGGGGGGVGGITGGSSSTSSLLSLITANSYFA